MKKYEIPTILNSEKVKFVVSVPDWSSDYQAMLYLTGKYKDDDIVIVICSKLSVDKLAEV